MTQVMKECAAGLYVRQTLPRCTENGTIGVQYDTEYF